VATDWVFTLGSLKGQQICRSSGDSSIGSCGGGGNVGAAAGLHPNGWGR